MSAFWAIKAAALLGGENEGAFRRALQTLQVEESPVHLNAWQKAAETAANLQGVTTNSLGLEGERLQHVLSGQPVPAPANLTIFDYDVCAEQFKAGPNTQGYARLWGQLANSNQAAKPIDEPHKNVSVWAYRSTIAAFLGGWIDDQPEMVLFQVGPREGVQSFVRAARRTHDSWIGSLAISYLATTVVRQIAEHVGPDAIVYPYPRALPLLDDLWGGPKPPSDRPLKTLSLAPNKILAIIPAKQKKSIVDDCRRTVGEFWQRAFTTAKEQFDKSAQHWPGWDEGAREQLENLWSIDIARLTWPSTPPEKELLALVEPLILPNQPGDAGSHFSQFFDICHRLIEAKRSDPTQLIIKEMAQGQTRPRCTLCGVRVQMGPDAQPSAVQEFWTKVSKNLQPSNEDRHALNLEPGEGLCAPCLARRFLPQTLFGDGSLGVSWEKNNQRRWLRFPSTASVATATYRVWVVRQALEVQAVRAALEQFCESQQKLHKNLLFTPPGNTVPGLDQWAKTPQMTKYLSYDGMWAFDDAYEPARALRDHGLNDDKNDPTNACNSALRGLKQLRHELKKTADDDIPTAQPYYAVLAMDVDRLGEWLSGRHEKQTDGRVLYPALHTELSRGLGEFGAKWAPKLVEDKYLGRLIYSGGDDLLALLPLRTAFLCADELQRTLRQPRHLGEKVTVSAGLALTHYHSPLEHALEAAHGALKLSKNGGRDRWTAIAQPRSGAPTIVTVQWRVNDESSIARLDKLAMKAENALSHKQVEQLTWEFRGIFALPSGSTQIAIERVQHITGNKELAAMFPAYAGRDQILEFIHLALFLSRHCDISEIDKLLQWREVES